MANLWSRMAQAAANVVSAADVSGVNAVLNQGWPDVSALTAGQFPAVIISREDVMPRLLMQTSAANDMLRPLRLWLADKATETASANTYTDLIETLAALFDSKRLDGVDEVQWCKVEYGMAFDRSLPQYRHCVSGIMLQFRTKEQR